MPKSEPSTCIFSEDRVHRYLLTHTWRDPNLPSYVPSKAIMWVGLNPSVANESQLDRTLRRVKGYSAAWGYDTFYMLNLFGLVSQDPKGLYTAADPIGPENDRYLLDTASRVDTVVAMWGTHGRFGGRAAAVERMLDGRLSVLKLNKDHSPAHCLYLPKTLTLTPLPVQPYPSLNPPIVPASSDQS